MAKKKLQIPLTESEKKNDAISYGAWVAEEGLNSDAAASGLRANALTKMAFDTPDRGVTADKLYSDNLKRSGYADYLKSQDGRAATKEMARAEEKRLVTEYKNKSGYESYLKGYNAEQKQISESLIDELAKEFCFDSDTAYERAVEKGLSKENSLFLASGGVRAAMKKAALNIIEFAGKKGYTPNLAWRYAKSVGLSDSYAKMVRDSVSKSLNEYEKTLFSGLSAEEYEELLKERNSNK